MGDGNKSNASHASHAFDKLDRERRVEYFRTKTAQLSEQFAQGKNAPGYSNCFKVKFGFVRLPCCLGEVGACNNNSSNGLLGKPQQGLRGNLCCGRRTTCRPAGLATKKDSPQTPTSRGTPCYGGDSKTGEMILYLLQVGVR